MENSLAGRKALIVGAYGGMGRAVAVELAREGIVCALMGRSQEKLVETAKACAEAGTEAVPVVCDIARTATIESAVRDAIDALDGLSYLINCAGVANKTRADDGDLATWDWVLDINLRATYHLTRHALPVINRSPGGAVIKIGSLRASILRGRRVSRLRARSRRLRGRPVRGCARVRNQVVCTIEPGYVNTPMVHGLDRPHDPAGGHSADSSLRPHHARDRLPHANLDPPATHAISQDLGLTKARPLCRSDACRVPALGHLPTQRQRTWDPCFRVLGKPFPRESERSAADVPSQGQCRPFMGTPR